MGLGEAFQQYMWFLEKEEGEESDRLQKKELSLKIKLGFETLTKAVEGEIDFTCSVSFLKSILDT